jgi:hypothetical protein
MIKRTCGVPLRVHRSSSKHFKLIGWIFGRGVAPTHLKTKVNENPIHLSFVIVNTYFNLV